jgi:hypothetical protein
MSYAKRVLHWPFIQKLQFVDSPSPSPLPQWGRGIAEIRRLEL